MEFKQIQELIKLINKSNLTEFKMKDGDFQLSIRTKKYGKQKPPVVQQATQQIVPVQAPLPATMQVQPVAPPASQPDSSPAESKAPEENGAAAESSNLIEVRSPIVGTFYRSPSPDKPPYVKVGDHINVGTVICIVEAMKLFNEIESEVSGRIVEVIADDASPVEYEQVLFKVDPNG